MLRAFRPSTTVFATARAFAPALLGLSGGLNDEEGRDFRAILERTYDRMETPWLRVPTPAIATYLGLEAPSGFDAIVIPPPPGVGGAAPSAAVLFLHGYAGGFYVYCWEIAQAARAANLLTICPSLDATGAWWTARGERTTLEALGFLRAQGIKRIYLAGLSNGAAGATCSSGATSVSPRVSS